MKITNPNFNTGIGAIRDPMIISYGGRYYMTGTSPQFWRGENPGVRIFVSDDLSHWEFFTLAVDSAKIAPDAPCRDRFWAPELFVYGGRFYVTFNAMNEKEAEEREKAGGNFYGGMRSFIAVSDNIGGPYIVKSEPLVNSGILTNDAHLFADDDGRVYLFYATDFGIFAREFYIESLCVTGNAHLIVPKGKSGEWDSIGVEGSFVVKRGGRYYHWYSSWTIGYEMGCSVSDSVLGPYEKCAGNPVISSGGQGKIKYCGHNSCFTLPDGRDAVAYHGNSDGEPESLCIEPVGYPPVPHAPTETFEV